MYPECIRHYLTSGLTDTRTGLNLGKQSTRITLRHQRLHRRSSLKRRLGHSISQFRTQAAASTTCVPSARRNLRISGSTQRRNGFGLMLYLYTTARTMHLALQRRRETAKLHLVFREELRILSLGSERQRGRFRRPRLEI